MTAQFPLVDALRFHDRHVLHAAAVERDGHAVVVLGESGAGKSTFAYAAAHAGWGIIADDLCVVEVGDGVHVTGFPKPVNVPSDVLAATPVDAARLAGDARDRWALPLRAITARGRYPVRALLRVAHADANADHAAIPASPLRIDQIVSSLPLATVPSAMRAFFPIAAQLSRLPTYLYRHAADPAQRVRSVERLLDALVGELNLEHRQ